MTRRKARRSPGISIRAPWISRAMRRPSIADLTLPQGRNLGDNHNIVIENAITRADIEIDENLIKDIEKDIRDRKSIVGKKIYLETKYVMHLSSEMSVDFNAIITGYEKKEDGKYEFEIVFFKSFDRLRTKDYFEHNN